MRRIKRFNIYQTAKVAAVVYFIISLIFVVPFFFLMSSSMRDMPGAQSNAIWSVFAGVGLIFVPILYAGFGFVGTAIFCGIYNLVSGWTGGIEVEVEEV
ncbi:MAG: hypothetical protein EP332_01015 [Bacteroidetes bacterium]|nr:MAG: hypothetical protein EP332_01015 [Bacteroidota bacterium]